MATLYRNWTVTVQDSQSPYSPINSLELHLFEGKVEIKTAANLPGAPKKVFIYGTSTEATYVLDNNNNPAIAFATDDVKRPGEYDFLSLDLNNNLTPNSKGGLTLYSVVGRPAGAPDFSSGRVIIDSTSLDDPNVKQTVYTLGGGLGSVIDNIFYAGGTVTHEPYSVILSTSDTLYVKITDLPNTLTNLTEELPTSPPFYDIAVPGTCLALIPRFNVTYTDKSAIVARWKSCRAYQMSDGSFVIRLRGDQYSIYRTNEFGLGTGEVNLTALEASMVISIDIEDQNTNYRTFNKSPVNSYAIPTTGPEGVLFSVYERSGVDIVGIGKWSYTNSTTDTPVFGIDGKHISGFRLGTPSYPNLLVGIPNGMVGINIIAPLATLHIVDIEPYGAPHPSMCVGTLGTQATSGYAVAIGKDAVASGQSSFALGESAAASGLNAYAIGFGAIASQQYSLALGYNATASGISSTALGYGAVASGSASIAFGRNITVSGATSFGISLSSTGGTVSTANLLSIIGGKVAIGTTAVVGTSILSVLDTTPTISLRSSSTSAPLSDMSLGALDFSSMYLGVPANSGASIEGRSTSTTWDSGAGNYPTRLTFKTRAQNTATSVERMSLLETGQLSIGDTNADYGNLLKIASTIATLGTRYLGMEVTTVGGSAYFGQYKYISYYGTYLGNVAGFSTNNLIVASTGLVGIGVALGNMGTNKLSVQTDVSTVAKFNSTSSLGQLATIEILAGTQSLTNYTSTYISTYNSSDGNSYISSFGPIAGSNNSNLNIYTPLSHGVPSGPSLTGIGTTTPKNTLDVSGGVALGTYAGVYSVNILRYDVILGGGRLGVGMTDPQAALDVILFPSTTVVAAFRATTAASILMSLGNSADTMYFGMSSGGKSFLGTATSVSSAEIVFDGTGNIGIGTSVVTSGYKLEVSGHVHVNGSYTGEGNGLFGNMYSSTIGNLNQTLTNYGMFYNKGYIQADVNQSAHKGAFLSGTLLGGAGAPNETVGLVLAHTFITGDYGRGMRIVPNLALNAVIGEYIGYSINVPNKSSSAPSDTGTITSFTGLFVGRNDWNPTMTNVYGLDINLTNIGNNDIRYGIRINVAGDSDTVATARRAIYVETGESLFNGLVGCAAGLLVTGTGITANTLAVSSSICASNTETIVDGGTMSPNAFAVHMSTVIGVGVGVHLPAGFDGQIIFFTSDITPSASTRIILRHPSGIVWKDTIVTSFDTNGTIYPGAGHWGCILQFHSPYWYIVSLSIG